MAGAGGGAVGVGAHADDESARGGGPVGDRGHHAGAAAAQHHGARAGE
ncbi:MULTISPECIES: hypothetical protein [Nocardia]|nr:MULTISPECIES: hypothetical protein [Nocardia]